MSATRALLPACLAAALVLALPVAAAPPDAQHQQLNGLAGEWSVQQSLWLKPGQPPQLDKGHANFSWVLNGRHLRQNLHIEGDTPFDGLGFLGYDDAAGAYFTTWMDVNFNGLVVAKGAYDGAAHAYTLKGRMAAAHGPDVPVREVISVRDADHFTYEFYETHDGKEALGVRLDYTRAPS